MKLLASISLVAVLAELGWLELGQDRSSGEPVQRVRDRADPHPARRILLLGNSRTSGHGMPGMLRQIAESAKDPAKYQTLTLAPSGSSFKTLGNDWRVEREVAGS